MSYPNTQYPDVKAVGDIARGKKAVEELKECVRLALIREFVADAEAAYGPDAEGLDDHWPDLFVTYKKAKDILAKLEK